ncbi:FecR domain-containing protein [Ferruginibacter paludis]|uniref:FecR family protein n=1 Tax=Ferruginibacter paludis TaxID=1310417 RepID=UPI0025B5B7FB|nr:FecR family protein [Ferruginibacter paludis]MDN3655156.1 FecR domain-containing protein [Ferruginibacter paludis]
MSQSRLAYLFKVYFNETATAQERDELTELLLQRENDAEVQSLITETWRSFETPGQQFTKEQSEDMFANILAKGKAAAPVINHNKNYFFITRRVAAAAVIFVAVLGTWFLIKSKPGPQPIVQVQKNSMPKKAITPGGDKAMLTLADGSTIILDTTHQGELTKQGTTKVVRLNTATLAYNAGAASNPDVVYNTLATPVGGQYQLILPDGSKVWLNASSSIHFPTIFKGKERKVSVTGEAYFEVAKNAAMPFKITVKNMEVEVLGTHFDIMAYDDENSVNTTLLEGSVKVSEGAAVKMLVPGQQSLVDKTGAIKIEAADVEEVMAWKNGWFQFNSADIQTVMRQISRWYNVDVAYEGKIPAGHFTGVVSRNNDISQVLKIMQDGGVRFKIEGRKLIVLA